MRIFNYCLLISLTLTTYAGMAWAENSSAKAGREQGNKVLEHYNTVEKLKTNAIAPFTGNNSISPNTPREGVMRTMTAQTTGGDTLPCPASKQALKLTVGVTVGGGDISKVTLDQDTDLNGRLDYTYITPRVSGICGAGIISCDPGSWLNCRYYQWTADITTKKLSLVMVPAQALGECYCINNSCAPNIVAEHMSLITKDLGAGMVSRLRADSSMAIVATVITPGTAIYAGRDIRNDICKNTNQDYAEAQLTTNPATYYADTTARERDIAIIADAPNSMSAKVKSSGERVQALKKRNNNFARLHAQVDIVTSSVKTTRTGPDSDFTLYYNDTNGSLHSVRMAARNTYGDITDDTACAVRDPNHNNTQAAPAGHIGLFRFSVAEPWLDVRKCVNNVCPVKVGEEIAQDCSPTDNYKDAVTAISLIEATKRTVICSSGVKR